MRGCWIQVRIGGGLLDSCGLFQSELHGEKAMEKWWKWLTGHRNISNRCLEDSKTRYERMKAWEVFWQCNEVVLVVDVGMKRKVKSKGLSSQSEGISSILASQGFAFH